MNDKLNVETANNLGKLIAHCPARSVVRGMVRMAEDTADEGDTVIAKHIWLAVIHALEWHNEFMYLAKLVGDGNKMIGIAPDEQKRGEYIRKSIEAAQTGDQL